MREYGTVKTAFWTDPKIAALHRDTKHMVLYLLTSPHTNALGCFRAPAQYIAADMNEDVAWVEEQMGTLIEAGIVQWDRATGWVWLRNYLRHNPPANGNVAKKCWREYDLIPDDVPFKDRVLDGLKTVSKRFQNQPETPEPEPEPEPDRGGARDRDAPPADTPPAPKRKPAERGSRLPEQWEPPPDGWR